MKLPKPDGLALVGILYGFFVTAFIYVLLETLAVPFVSDQYAWDDDKAMEIVGIALMGAGLLATCLFPLSGKVARKIDERKVMLFPGFLSILIGTLLFLPYPGHTIPMQECDTENATAETTEATLPTTSMWTSSNDSWDTFSVTEDDYNEHLPWPDYFSVFRQWSPLSAVVDETDDGCGPGCPWIQEWCLEVPQLPMAQLTVAFLIVMFGYPVAQSISQGLFSKMLGPKPQGLWMGVLTSVGSLSRVAGPIFVSYVYTKLGTYWCFGILCVFMVVAFTELTLLYKRLVPMDIPVPKTQHAYNGPAANA